MKPWQLLILGAILTPIVLGAGKGMMIMLNGLGIIIGAIITLAAIIFATIMVVARWPR